MAHIRTKIDSNVLHMAFILSGDGFPSPALSDTVKHHTTPFTGGIVIWEWFVRVRNEKSS